MNQYSIFFLYIFVHTKRKHLMLSLDVEIIKVVVRRRGNNREKRSWRKRGVRFISRDFLETSLRKFWSSNENYEVRLWVSPTSMAKSCIHMWPIVSVRRSFMIHTTWIICVIRSWYPIPKFNRFTQKITPKIPPKLYKHNNRFLN